MADSTHTVQEVAYFQRMLDEARVSDATLDYVGMTLFTARAIHEATSESPLRIRVLLEDAMQDFRDAHAKPREAYIRELHARFGLDACVRQLSYVGQRMPGVELPARVAELGERPSIYWRGEEVYQGQPAAVRDLYDVLTGNKDVDESAWRVTLGLLGMTEGSGEIALMRTDGVCVASQILSLDEIVSSDDRKRSAPAFGG